MPWCRAAYYCDKEMVNFLLCFNKRLLHNNGKETALDIARREGHWAVVDVFLPHLPKHKDWPGQTGMCVR